MLQWAPLLPARLTDSQLASFPRLTRGLRAPCSLVVPAARVEPPRPAAQRLCACPPTLAFGLLTRMATATALDTAWEDDDFDFDLAASAGAPGAGGADSGDGAPEKRGRRSKGNGAGAGRGGARSAVRTG